MKYFTLILFLSCQISICFAQFSKKEFVKLWGDSLPNYDPENKLYYDYREDTEYLYIALYKKDNAPKAYIQGGVQLQFDKDKITDKSFRITFSHKFPDPNNPQKTGDKKEYFLLENIGEIKNLLVPMYNEYGLQVRYDFNNDNSNQPKPEGPERRIRSEDVKKNISTFWAEITIPKKYLQASKLHVNICLRGIDLMKEGIEGQIRKGLWGTPKNTISDQENRELKYFTEHQFIINLN